MDFRLNEEQELIRASIREYCDAFIEPIAADIDESSRFPDKVFTKLGEMGYMGMTIPVDYGGTGLDYLTYTVVLEEIARSCAAICLDIACHTGCAMVIDSYGTPTQKEEYLPAMARGERIGAFCLTEPGVGSDAASVTATAVPDGDFYLIDGVKTFITNGPVADIFLVVASTDPSKGARGLSLFLIPKDTKGLKVGSHFMKMGLRASQTSEVVLKGCRVPSTNLIGKEGQGLKIGLNTLNAGRIAIAAQSVGLAQAALDESLAYARQRIQFGKPIATKQAIQWKLAEMAVGLEAARLLAYQAASFKDLGLPFAQEAAMAKLFASQMANKQCYQAVQIHGGYGLMKGVKVERLMRDVRATEIYEGTSEIQHVVIAGNLLA